MSAKAIELGLIGPALGQLPLDERATRGQVLQYIAFVVLGQSRAGLIWISNLSAW